MLVSDGELDEFLVSDRRRAAISWCCPAGTIPPNAADLLSVGRMGEVLSLLRESADVVIVDSPPLLPVADTRVLLRLSEVDGVIMVGRGGFSRRDRLRAASQGAGSERAPGLRDGADRNEVLDGERLLLLRRRPNQPNGRSGASAASSRTA